MARYTIKARNKDGELNLLDPLTIDHALRRAVELRDGGYRNIVLRNAESGAGVSDLMGDWTAGSDTSD